MASTVLKLKRAGKGEWRLYTPKGHAIGPALKGESHHVIAQARNFVSSWYNWSVDVSECQEGLRNEPQKD